MHVAAPVSSLQDTPVPFSAGLLSYASYFTIPPGKKSYLVQNNCCYRGFQPLTTFAVRVHTHTMGKQVFMTRPSAVQSGVRLASGGTKQSRGGMTQSAAEGSDDVSML